jgi:hypothetical protein
MTSKGDQIEAAIAEIEAVHAARETELRRVERQLGVAGVRREWSAVEEADGWLLEFDGAPIIRFETKPEAVAFLIGLATERMQPR